MLMFVKQRRNKTRSITIRSMQKCVETRHNNHDRCIVIIIMAFRLEVRSSNRRLLNIRLWKVWVKLRRRNGSNTFGEKYPLEGEIKRKFVVIFPLGWFRYFLLLCEVQFIHVQQYFTTIRMSTMGQNEMRNLKFLRYKHRTLYNRFQNENNNGYGYGCQHISLIFSILAVSKYWSLVAYGRMSLSC